MIKNPPASAGDAGSIPGLGGFPGGGRAWQPTRILLPGESHGQRSLVGYSLWGCKESDMTEQLTETHFFPNHIVFKSLTIKPNHWPKPTNGI